MAAEERLATVGRATPGRPESAGAPRAILGQVDTERTAIELLTVEALDHRGRLGVARELDEGEPARATGLPIGGKGDVEDRPGWGQELLEALLGGLEAQITDEDFGGNGSLLGRGRSCPGCWWPTSASAEVSRAQSGANFNLLGVNAIPDN
jgi:hypothetical protein